MTQVIKPERLHPDDTIGIIAPASPPPDPNTIERAVDALKKLGFHPKVGRNAHKRVGFLAGTDRERASDLMRMFTDKEVKAIFCVRGGYGTTRLLGLLDYKLIRNNPKIFVGYSDITALHCALQVRTSLVTFHGPMLNSELSKFEVSSFTFEALLKNVTTPRASESICTGYPEPQTIQALRKGRAEGRLLGGNLTLICSLLGTPYEPSFKGTILFWEEVDEAPYRIDRLLTQLLNAGKLQQVSGIAIGVNKACIDPKARDAKEFRQTTEDVIRERLLPLKVPLVYGLPFGHVKHICTLPMGVNAVLDANRGDLLIKEAAVR